MYNFDNLDAILQDSTMLKHNEYSSDFQNLVINLNKCLHNLVVDKKIELSHGGNLFLPLNCSSVTCDHKLIQAHFHNNFSTCIYKRISTFIFNTLKEISLSIRQTSI